jgi:hypothetical protein
MLKRSPVRSCSNSVERCCDVAGPAEATSIAPGRARACSASSWIVCAGKAGWQITISGTIAMPLIAVKSFSAS